MEVLRYTEKDVAFVRNYFQVTETAIKEKIAILKKWIQQQKHLPENQDDDFLERLLLRSEFKIEEAKKKLEEYYTIGKILKEYYQENNENMVPSRQNTVFLPLPRLTPKSERIAFYRLESDDPELYDVSESIKFIALILEILLRNDYSIGDRLLVDFGNFSPNHVPKITAAGVSNFATLYTKVYSTRPKSFDFFNCPPSMNLIMETIKLSLPGELCSIIKIHDDLTSLYEIYPKECLPSDYGGKLESIQELTEKWDVVFEKNQQMFNDRYKEIYQKNLKFEAQHENGSILKM